MRRRLAAELSVAGVVCVAGCGRVGFDDRGDAAIEAPCAFTRTLRVTASSDPLGDDYSVMVQLDHAASVAAGRSTGSGDDVRVRYGERSIDRVLDTGSAWNTATTQVWFRLQAALDAGASDASYSLCYGPAVLQPPRADGDRVFLLWDDFSAGAIDPIKWGTIGNASIGVTETGGELAIDGTTDVAGQYDVFGISSLQMFSTNLRIETYLSILVQSSLAQQNWKALPGLTDSGLDFTGVLMINSEHSLDKRVESFVSSVGAWNDLADSSFDATTFAHQHVTEIWSAAGTLEYFENGVPTYSQAIPDGDRRVAFGYGPDVPGGGETVSARFGDIVVRRYVASDAAINLTLGAERP